ncbi:MAG: Hsp20/alpha crystallin family protein [Candidatus Marinimicrobia bacterium]|nr:Hsp20/alpha crystallin family protein [Candidatus Neomarinimicrobiota bacterium]
MNIISWKPKPKVLVNDIDSVLDNFFQNDWSFEKRKNLDGNWVPSVDISENEKDVFIITELAGVRKTDLTITLSENQLKISGIKNKPKEIDDQRQYLKGSKYGKFEKIINISENIIDDKINASFKNGVLKVILPKLEKIPPKKKVIPIS